MNKSFRFDFHGSTYKLTDELDGEQLRQTFLESCLKDYNFNQATSYSKGDGIIFNQCAHLTKNLKHTSFGLSSLVKSIVEFEKSE